MAASSATAAGPRERRRRRASRVFAPSTNMTVTATASGDADLTVISADLTFTPANWDLWQLVTVAAAEDADRVSGTGPTSRCQLLEARSRPTSALSRMTTTC